MGCGVVERHLEMAKPTKNTFSLFSATIFGLKSIPIFPKSSHNSLFLNSYVVQKMLHKLEIFFNKFKATRSVGPKLGKFRYFGKNVKVFGHFLNVYFTFGKILNLLWQMLVGKFSL